MLGIEVCHAAAAVPPCHGHPWPSRCQGVFRCVCLGASCPKDRLSIMVVGASFGLLHFGRSLNTKRWVQDCVGCCHQVGLESLRSSPVLLRQRGTVLRMERPQCKAHVGTTDGCLEVSVRPASFAVSLPSSYPFRLSAPWFLSSAFLLMIQMKSQLH